MAAIISYQKNQKSFKAGSGGVVFSALPASAPVNLLFDLFPGAGFGYSYRKLRTLHINPDIKARENANSQDIGFLEDVIDSNALLAFTGSNDGFIPIVYDQSTNANNLTQTIASEQLQIVDAGALITSNNLAAAQWANRRGGIVASIAFSGMTDIWFFDVLDVTTTSAPQVLYESSPNYANNTGAFLIGIEQNAIRVSNRNSLGEGRNNYDISTGRQVISIRMRAGVSIATFSEVYINGVQIPLASTVGGGNSVFSNQTLYLSRGGRFFGFLGKRQELTFYSTDQSSNRVGIETNLINYYFADSFLLADSGFLLQQNGDKIIL